jgi:large subunit ribosomal protein L3
MIPAILARKIGVTRVFDEQGTAIPVTVVQAGPCTVMQVRTRDRDGYDAVQLGFGDVKPHRATLPMIGHAAAAGTGPKAFIREIRLVEPTDTNVGDVVTVDIFEEAGVKYVDVSGTTKGRGFQGPMRRYGFGGQPASHGTERKHRSPGSIGSHGTDLGHGGNIKKGKKMGGHMGHVRRTAKNQPLVGVNTEQNLLLIGGSVPGPNGGYVVVRRAKTKSQRHEAEAL